MRYPLPSRLCLRGLRHQGYGGPCRLRKPGSRKSIAAGAGIRRSAKREDDEDLPHPPAKEMRMSTVPGRVGHAIVGRTIEVFWSSEGVWQQARSPPHGTPHVNYGMRVSPVCLSPVCLSPVCLSPVCHQTASEGMPDQVTCQITRHIAVQTAHASHPDRSIACLSLRAGGGAHRRRRHLVLWPHADHMLRSV